MKSFHQVIYRECYGVSPRTPSGISSSTITRVICRLFIVISTLRSCSQLKTVVHPMFMLFSLEQFYILTDSCWE